VERPPTAVPFSRPDPGSPDLGDPGRGADAEGPQTDPGVTVLSYAPAAPGVSGRRRSLLLLLLALPAYVLPFLGFVHGISPFDAAAEFLRNPLGESDRTIGLMGLSFFVCPLVVTYHGILLLHSGRRPPLRRALAALAVLGALANLPLLLLLGTLYYAMATEFLLDSAGFTMAEALMVLVPAAILISGILLAFRAARQRDSATFFSFAYATPFVANAVFCLVIFFQEGWGPGYLLAAYLVAVTTTDVLIRSRS
jgi:hypothetical protein